MVKKDMAVADIAEGYSFQEVEEFWEDRDDVYEHIVRELEAGVPKSYLEYNEDNE
jgi:hypothetical protein